MLILKYFCFYRGSYFDLNWTKYFMLQEFDVNLDLTEIFGLKKNLACSPDLSPIEYIRKYKYYWISKKIFNIMSLKQNWSLSNSMVQLYLDN